MLISSDDSEAESVNLDTCKSDIKVKETSLKRPYIGK
jgi:hypothetical protein